MIDFYLICIGIAMGIIVYWAAVVMINVFIGYDSKEKVAFSVLAYSILRNSTKAYLQ